MSKYVGLDDSTDEYVFISVTGEEVRFPADVKQFMFDINEMCAEIEKRNHVDTAFSTWLKMQMDRIAAQTDAIERVRSEPRETIKGRPK